MRQPAGGIFKYPWIKCCPGGIYGDACFLWDIFHVCIRLATEGDTCAAKHMAKNFLMFAGNDGYIPRSVHPLRGLSDNTFNTQPFVAQLAYLGFVLGKDKKELAEYWDVLEKYIEYEERWMGTTLGVFRFKADGGIDNNPACMFLPTYAVASVNATAYMVMEYRAMAYMAKFLHKRAQAQYYKNRALETIKDFNRVFWHAKDQTYYNWNLLASGKKEADFGIPSLVDGPHIRVPSWTNLVGLYARIVPEKRAKIQIKKWLLNPDEHWSPWGVRSLSKRSPYYNNAVLGNPMRAYPVEQATISNWQGPVWILSNYQMFHALLNYGFYKEAEELADKTINLLARSLSEEKTFYENYDAETGKGLFAADFGSWNVLADIMHHELDNGWILEKLVGNGPQL